VLDLVTHGMDAGTAGALSEVLSAEIAARPGTQVITAADVTAMLGFEKQRQMLGCEANEACIAELAGALGVDKIVSGSVGQIEDVYLLNLRLIDVKRATAEGRVYERVEKKSALIDAVRSGARRLWGELEARPEPSAAALKAQPPPAPVVEPGTAAAPVTATGPAPAAAVEAPAENPAHDFLFNTGWGLVGLGVVTGVAGAVLMANNPTTPGAQPPLGFQLGNGSLWFGLGSLGVGGLLLLADLLIFGVQQE
jgi:hypothetical protein